MRGFRNLESILGTPKSVEPSVVATESYAPLRPVNSASADPSGVVPGFDIKAVTVGEVRECQIMYLGMEGNIRCYRVLLTGSIFDIHRYANFLTILRCADENTRIDLIIDSPGGCVFTGTTIASAIINSKATVTGIALHLAASIAATIWSSCDNLVMARDASIMYHMSSHGMGGNSRAVGIASQAIAKYTEECLIGYVRKKGLLTDEEAELLIEKGRDIFIPYLAMQNRGVSILKTKKDRE